MEKIYLKYYNDKEYRNPVECDFGPAWQMIWEGGIYAYKKKDISRALILALLHICAITLAFIVAPIPLSIVIAILFVLVINLLFAFNYNMIVIEAFIREGYLPMDSNSSDKLIKKGIYFKLQ
jgi:hypothetical protein